MKLVLFGRGKVPSIDGANVTHLGQNSGLNLYCATQFPGVFRANKNGALLQIGSEVISDIGPYISCGTF